MSRSAAALGRDVVAVAGPDAPAYLQGQLSQDIDSLGEGESAWTLVLAPTGKVDVWFRLHRTAPDRFLADTDPGFGEALSARLERFKLRSDLTVEPVTGWNMIRVLTGAADRAAPSDATGVELTAERDWPGLEGVDLLGPSLEIPASCPVLTNDEYEARRIAAGWPVMGADLGSDTIPAEAGAALLERSVSFTKGCYTGQELVARIESRGGNVPRPLRVLVGPPAADVAPGDPVTVGGDTVANITSAAGDTLRYVALAPLPRRIDVGDTVAVGEASFTVAAAPA